MRKNPLTKGTLTSNTAGIGSVTRRMILARAKELALIAGRTKATPGDVDEARRELTGGPAADPKDAVLESAPESERWDPVPGSSGRQAPETPDEEEDEEGRNEAQQLVEEGVSEAEHDQMLQAARAARSRGRRRT